MAKSNLPNNQSIFKTCSVEGCSSASHPKCGKGMCVKHYRRFKRYGDPLKTKIFTSSDSLEKRIWSQIKIVGSDDCWLWQAGVDRDGYGQISVNRKHGLAHRYVWFLTYGQWPTLNVLHSCDNPPCCNPNHLREGTKKENADDRVKRGRQINGEKSHLSKLTEENVREIKRLLTQKRLKEIAKQFGVTSTAISCIKTGKTWKHIAAPNQESRKEK